MTDNTVVKVEGKDYTITINPDGTLKGVPVGPKYWEPTLKNSWFVQGNGTPCPWPIESNITNHNIFETEALATKASALMRRSNAIIRACLLVDPNYIPDWTEKRCYKYSIYFSHTSGAWNYCAWTDQQHNTAHVSSAQKALEVCRLLTEWGVK